MMHYFYDPKTFEYIGSMPASGHKDASAPFNSTTDEPNPPEGHFPFRNVETNEWHYVEDHRGKTAYAKDLSGELTIETCGSVPDEYTLIAPPEYKQGFQVEWKRKQWGYVEDHRGEEGTVDGNPVTISELGKLPDGWTPKEQEYVKNRRKAYQSEVDPISSQIQGYQFEADALRLSGDEVGARICDEKAANLLAELLKLKYEIRAKFPKE